MTPVEEWTGGGEEGEDGGDLARVYEEAQRGKSRGKVTSLSDGLYR